MLKMEVYSSSARFHARRDPNWASYTFRIQMAAL